MRFIVVRHGNMARFTSILQTRHGPRWKSTFSTVLRALVDPNEATMRSLPRTEEVRQQAHRAGTGTLTNTVTTQPSPLSIEKMAEVIRAKTEFPKKTEEKAKKLRF
ncbi:MAG: hypothetical protein V2I76_09800 [Roseobacter sp.]|jgi:hypothetical protein|nr:hypothetical protein [Roseobacter sp.]